jgi:YidC/Oxa1 family membrane protein insertase
MQQQRNLLIFFLVAALLLLGTHHLRQWLWPPPPKPEADKVAKKAPDDKKDDKKKEEPKPLKPPPPPDVTAPDKLLTLGNRSSDSKFHLYVLLDPLGGGVRTVVLNKFKQATAGGLPTDEPLALVGAEANRQIPSHMLYHFEPGDEKLEHPLDTLGRIVWKVVKKDGKAVVTDEIAGKTRQTVSFRAEVEGVVITKTYQLTEGDYHIGLRIDLERPKASTKAKAADKQVVKFRYQLTGAKGLPVEGKWYTTTYRNALFGMEDQSGGFYRDLEELRYISVRGGGDLKEAKGDGFLRYAGVAVQYFASVIVVDDTQEKTKFLRRARATLETAVFRGKLKVDENSPADRVVVQSEDGKTEEMFFLPPELQGVPLGLKDGMAIAVIYRPLTWNPADKKTFKLAISLHVGDSAAATHELWEDDITVRVTSEQVELKPGSKVSHHYLLYNGPVKPSLLGQLTGEKEVPSEVVERYNGPLKLNTLTDWHSPGWPGAIASTIGWTFVVIKCTNVMHWVLGLLHSIVSSYGLCIILLTVMVRGMMFPLSRKQALMGMKMQALAPEMKKLQEKYKDDKQALSLAQWELWRKHGVSPFGSCWIIFLQMPIFMGLYYALQESIQFRLAGFWPTWIHNLAAPDMMIRWGESIPLISNPAYFGQFFYLGPYFNLLPVLAVTLMILQQKLLMPPPTDEQQEFQQKLMKWMMVVMGLFFYKVAAGLCIYFIASSLWGFAERKLLPKTRLAKAGSESDKAPVSSTAITTTAKAGSATAVMAPSGVTPSKKPGRNKRKAAERDRRSAAKEEETQTRLGRLKQRLSNWWNDVLEQAKKK